MRRRSKENEEYLQKTAYTRHFAWKQLLRVCDRHVFMEMSEGTLFSRQSEIAERIMNCAKFYFKCER